MPPAAALLPLQLLARGAHALLLTSSPPSHATPQGMGGVNYQQVLDATARHGATAPPIYAASKTLPWACRIAAPGRVRVGGAKVCTVLYAPVFIHAVYLSALSCRAAA